MNATKLLLILSLGLLFNLTYAQQNDKQLINYFDEILSDQYKADEPGATVLISRKGEVIYKKAFGMANLELKVPMQLDNVFWIASIGKQFTAVSILQLIEKGKLNLQDEITRFIPDYPTRGNKITIEHLLTHTSGIHNYSGMEDPEKIFANDCTTNEVIDFFKNLPMRFAPGTKWEYSNSGYFLLGYIIEKITGKPYSEYLNENIFKPLGMANSHFANNKGITKNRVGAYSFGDNGYENSRFLNITHIYSAGAIQSTVEDFYKWHQAVHSYKLVNKETLDKAFTRYRLTDGKYTDYGYGWKLGYVYESPSIWHGGAIEGYGAMEIYLPKEDVFVVVFTNCDCNYPKDIATKLAAIAAGKAFEYKELPISSSSLPEYAGVYENEKGQLRAISVSENKLYSQVGRNPKFNIKAFQKDHFFFEDPMVTIEFLRDKNGQVDKLTSKKIAGNEMWTKTNKPIPSADGIKLDGKILEAYVGNYEVSPDFSFAITKEQDKLFLQAEGQDKLEMFAENETKFFLKVNDAQFEFVKDGSGKVIKAIMNQGGRNAEASKL